MRSFAFFSSSSMTVEKFSIGIAPERKRPLMKNEVVAPTTLEEASLDWAAELAANAPLSIAGNKRVIRELQRAHSRLDPDLARELMELRRESFASHDLREGVRAFGDKRRARWRGR